MDTEQADLLVGRSHEIEKLVSWQENSKQRATIVHAASGVGKTSVLRAGVVPRLQGRGYTVIVFRDWSSLIRKSAAQAIMSAFEIAFRHAADPDHPDYGGDKRLAVHADRLKEMLIGPDPQDQAFVAMDYLSEQFGRKLVIIFDQMEEILRLDRVHGLEFVRTITSLLQPDARTQFRTILSLRSEFVSELGALERDLYREYWDRLQLNPVIHPKWIDEAIMLPKVGPEQGAWRFDGDLARQLRDLWLLAAFDTLEEQPPGTVPMIGLLHLQASLWILWKRAAIGADDTSGLVGSISAKTVRRLVTRSATESGLSISKSLKLVQDLQGSDESDGGKFWRGVFEGILEEYVELSVHEHVKQTSRRRFGTEIAAETNAQVARIAPKLSSGSYKVLADSDEIAQEVGLDILPPDAAKYFGYVIKVARNRAADFLSAIDQDEAGDAGRLAELVAEELSSTIKSSDSSTEQVARAQRIREVRRSLADSTSRKFSAGRLRREHATMADLVHEMAATHERAVSWLIDSAVVRETPEMTSDEDPRGRRFLSVIHDGYGPALRHWGLTTLQDIDSIRSPLVVVRGLSPLAPMVPDESLDSTDGSVDGPTIEPGFAADAVVGVQFHNLVWQGCDITRDLVDVTFEDCDLRGTVFFGCRFRNLRIRNCVTFGTIFIGCSFSGVTLLEAQKEAPEGLPDALAAEIRAERLVRGLSIEQNCTFEPGSELRFRSLRGTGLFITETQCPSWSFDYCRLEDVLIQLDSLPTGQSGKSPKVRGTVRESVIHHFTVGNSLLQLGGTNNAKQTIRFDGVGQGNEIFHLTTAPGISIDGDDHEGNKIEYRWVRRQMEGT